MDSALRLKVTMAVRVRDLLVANPFGDEAADQVSAQFVAQVERAHALLTQQESGELAARTATRHRRALRREMLQVPLRHLVTIARSVAVANPGVASGIRRPAFGRSEEAFQASVRALMQEVESHRELFVASGMSPESLDELNAQLAAYQEAVGEANAGRRAHTGARAELRAVTRELMRLLNQLDGIVVYRYRDRADLLGSWKSARNVAWPAPEPAKSGEAGPAEVKPAA